MPSRKRLIVNADDFGLSVGVNAGILAAHDEGIVTSASLMVRQEDAAAAVDEARRRPRLSVGLHLDLGEWVFHRGKWKTVYEVVPLVDEAKVLNELERQILMFRQLMGGDPSHLDSHQHVHRREPVRSVAKKLADSIRIPLRHFSPAITYCGSFYGQNDAGEPLPDAISAEKLIDVIAGIGNGITELACHPSADSRISGMYRTERTQELKALCDVRLREVITESGIELCSFREVSAGIAKLGSSHP